MGSGFEQISRAWERAAANFPTGCLVGWLATRSCCARWRRGEIKIMIKTRAGWLAEDPVLGAKLLGYLCDACSESSRYRKVFLLRLQFATWSCDGRCAIW